MLCVSKTCSTLWKTKSSWSGQKTDERGLVKGARKLVLCQEIGKKTETAEPYSAQRQRQTLPLRAWISLALLPQASATRKTCLQWQELRSMMVLTGSTGGSLRELCRDPIGEPLRGDFASLNAASLKTSLTRAGRLSF